MNRSLRATTRTGLTAQEALTWWHSASALSAAPGEPVGFGFSAKAATWWRLDDGRPLTRTGPASLDRVYELVAFDGDRELRWRNDDDGRGRAVVLADAPEQLPADGTRVDHKGRTARSEEPQRRLLGGKTSPLDGDRWVRLVAARYAPVEIPVRASGDLTGAGDEAPVVVLESVEYTAEDGHGNLSIVDRRLTRLQILPRRDLHLDLTGKG